MPKIHHEIRDPIHIFVRLDEDELRLIDSEPFQRLRHIHQLALSYLVYPSATHKRFEHSLGVMELADRIYNVVTDPGNLTDRIRDLLPQVNKEDARGYWRKVLRAAALCHDLGHLPFSHAAEHELLPEDWDHETLTAQLILSPEMRRIWEQMTPPLTPEHIVKIAVGPKKAKDQEFSDWEAIVSEIIVGNAFGADRIDYLLRDSYHAGVAYGRFDHYRLVDTLRILPPPPTPPPGTSTEQLSLLAGMDHEPDPDEGSEEPMLGVQLGGLQSAEALLIARYFMFSQVYLHPARRAYDMHLVQFLKAWLPEGRFPVDVSGHLRYTDNEVLAGIRSAAREPGAPGHGPARRIHERRHFRVLYRSTPDDIEVNPNAGEVIYDAARERFGAENVLRDQYRPGSSAPDFPVWMQQAEHSYSAHSLSQPLRNLPPTVVDFVYVAPELARKAHRWLTEHRKRLIRP